MSITTKRKAQNLVREGKVDEAIEQMREWISDGDADPYDHVYLGDLLMRTEDTESGLQAYETAIRSYEEVGLFRNAIAIGKKLLRTDSGRHEVQRTLGRLYDQEDLQGEAISHYLGYLDSLSGEAVPPQEFLEILDRAASITGSKVEVALRLTDHFLRLNRGDRAAALLDSVADHCERAGSEEMASDLRGRAVEAAKATSGENTGPGDEPQTSVELELEMTDAIPLEDNTIEMSLEAIDLSCSDPVSSERETLPEIPLDDGLFGVGDSSASEFSPLDLDIEDASATQTESTGELGGFDSVDLATELDQAIGDSLDPGGPSEEPNTFDLEISDPSDFGSVNLDGDSDGSSEEAVWTIAGDTATSDASECGNLGFGNVELNSSDASTGDDDAALPGLESAFESPESLNVPDLPLPPATAETLVVPGQPASEPTLESADDAYLEGRWSDARVGYEYLLQSEPNQRRVLSKLVETVRYLEDAPGEMHYQVLLGDAWITEEEYEEAMDCFLAVLKLDPENETAQRRLARFRDLGVDGTDGENELNEATSNSVPSLLETGRTEVAVTDADSSEFRSDDWGELEGLLEEFKNGLKEHMDDGDYQAHYDLALSHHSMGLIEESLESVDLALGCSGIPDHVVRQARELRGGCLLALQRNREAVHEYRETLEQSKDDVQSRRTALYNLGSALESVEEWQEAYQTFSQLRVEAPGHLDVEQRMHGLEGRLTSSGDTEAA